MRLTGADSQAPLRAEPDVSYAELNVTALSAPRVRRDGGGLSSTYAEVNFPKDEPVIDEDEASPIAAGPRNLPTNAQTGPQKQDPEENIGNRSHRKICLLCLVTFAFIAIVAGLSIFASQIRQSQINSDVKYQLLWEQYLEMNRTQTQYRQQAQELNLSNSNCLQNISALKNNLSILETKIRTFKWIKGEICQFLASSREQTCSQDWIRNKDRCYYISTFETAFHKAIQECSNRDSRLLEINSSDEASFVSRKLVDTCRRKQGTLDWKMRRRGESWTDLWGETLDVGGQGDLSASNNFTCEKCIRRQFLTLGVKRLDLQLDDPGIIRKAEV
ncbi:oxidized low-density lipoprotein receptor 1-like [Hemitrygon akajei]|uniref:oxidized low-density lipoprotein receptor 1-like n=1 Tax=Hemitrygon akajei TaxID=2704970 RepID=UPI003BF95594